MRHHIKLTCIDKLSLTVISHGFGVLYNVTLTDSYNLNVLADFEES